MQATSETWRVEFKGFSGELKEKTIPYADNLYEIVDSIKEIIEKDFSDDWKEIKNKRYFLVISMVVTTEKREGETVWVDHSLEEKRYSKSKARIYEGGRVIHYEELKFWITSERPRYITFKAVKSFDESVYDSPYEDPNKGDSEEYELVKSNPSDSDSTNGSQSDPEKIGDDMFDPDLIDDVLPAIKLSKSEETDNETVGG